MRVPITNPKLAPVLGLGTKPSKTTLAMAAALMHQQGQLFQPKPSSDEDMVDANTPSN